ncbi:hypothetical protein [Streptomyces sp. NPDC001221]
MARIPPEKREEAARLLAAGRGAEFIASRLRISPATVRAWRRNDPAFQALIREHLAGLEGQGLLAIADGSAPRTVRMKVSPGMSPTERARAVATEIGRRQARRNP